MLSYVCHEQSFSVANNFLYILCAVCPLAALAPLSTLCRPAQHLNLTPLHHHLPHLAQVTLDEVGPHRVAGPYAVQALRHGGPLLHQEQVG